MATQVIQGQPSARAQTMQQIGQALGIAGAGLGQMGMQQFAGQQQLERQRQLMQEEAALRDTRLGVENTKKLLGQVLGPDEVKEFEGLDLTAGEVSNLADSFTRITEARRKADLTPTLTEGEKRVASYLIQKGVPVTPENLLTYRLEAEASQRAAKDVEAQATKVTQPKGPAELTALTQKLLRTEKNKPKNFVDIPEDEKLALEQEYALADKVGVVVETETFGKNDAALVDVDIARYKNFVKDKGYSPQDEQSGMALAEYLIQEKGATEESANQAIARLQKIRMDLAKQAAPLRR